MSPYRVFPILTVSLICLVCKFQAQADSAPAKSVHTDAYGDPLPPGALLRLGTVRWRAQAHFVAFLPDGKTLLTVDDDCISAGIVRFWDIAAGKEISHIQTPGSLLALSPDGKTLALNSYGVSDAIVFVSVPTGKEVRRLVEPYITFDHLEYSADGKTFAAADRNGVFWFFDAKTGANTGRLTAYALWRFRMSLSPDGKQILLAGQDNTLRVVDVASEKEVFEQQIRPKESGWSFKASFSPDGKKLAWLGEAKNTFALWDISSGKAVVQFPGPPGVVESVLFSPDGKRIASVQCSEEGGSIHLWDTSTGQELHQFVTAAHATDALAFSPDGKRLAAVGGFDGVVHLWDVETGMELNHIGENQGAVGSAVFSPDGRTVFTASTDGMIRVWDARTGVVTRQMHVVGTKGHRRLDGVVFSSDGSAAAVNYLHGKPELWDLNFGKRRAALEDDKVNYAIAFTPDGKTLASIDDSEKGVQLWDAATGKKERQITIAMNEDRLVNFAFSPDGKTLLAAQNVGAFNLGSLISFGTGELSLWDAAAGKELSKCGEGMRLNSAGLRFSPDGKLVVALDGRQVHLWNRATQKELTALSVSKDRPDPGFNSTAFSPNGETLAAAGYSGDIYLWEVNTAEVRHVFKGHRGRVSSLEFSPDGSRLLSGSADTTAIIWDLAQRRKP
jgi:WD40 repeat protein